MNLLDHNTNQPPPSLPLPQYDRYRTIPPRKRQKSPRGSRMRPAYRNPSPPSSPEHLGIDILTGYDPPSPEYTPTSPYPRPLSPAPRPQPTPYAQGPAYPYPVFPNRPTASAQPVAPQADQQEDPEITYFSPPPKPKELHS